MRDYRGKRIDNGEMVEGDKLTSNGKTYIVVECETSNQYGDGTDLYATEWYEVDPETVGQYSEETDANNKEIYGGSILKIDPYYGDETYIVVVEEKDGSFLIDTPYTNDHDMTVLAWYIREFGRHTVEAVGNVWDNPDLLGG